MARNDRPSTIVITGITRGLGRAMAEEFIRRGHIVAGCGRSQRLISGLAQKFSAPHRFSVVDVASDASVQRWANSVLRVITPDVLINNAGLLNPPILFEHISPKGFARIIDVNFKGTANVVRHFLPAMKRALKSTRGQNRIVVNFSSRWGHSAEARLTPYCMTKWAIEGFTGALAKELPPQMAVYAVDPRLVNTAMLRRYVGRRRARRYPTPQIWAQKNAVNFILSLCAGAMRRYNGKSIQMDVIDSDEIATP